MREPAQETDWLNELALALTLADPLTEWSLAWNQGHDAVSRTTEQLLQELTFYRWLAGFQFLAKVHHQNVSLPLYETRYQIVTAELEGRGVPTARDYTTYQGKPTPKPGGVEL